jgi:hypothetical protein
MYMTVDVLKIDGVSPQKIMSAIGKAAFVR